MDRERSDDGQDERSRDNVSRSSTESEGDSKRVDTPGPLPQYQYDRAKLNDLSRSPAAKMWPSFLAKEYTNEDGCWDPEKWFRGASPLQTEFQDRKKLSSLDMLPPRRRPSDPKERLKEERDGIVLSPQRRSFGTGCHVTQSSNLLRQQSCPSDFRDGNDRDRDRRDQRRIGSGRIQIDREQQQQQLRGERDRDFHRERFDREPERERERERSDTRRFDNNDRFRRDGDRRDLDRRDLDRRRDGRDYRGYGGRRSYHRHEEEEPPEWFTEGPISQTDTIELRGFDRVDEEEEDTPREIHEEKKRLKENHSKQTGIAVTDRNGSLETNESSSPEAENQSARETRHSPAPQASLFDFNEFFNIENIPGLSDGPSPESEVRHMGSRFSQWFQAPGSQGNSRHNSRHNSRRSSLNEEFTYLNDLIGGNRSPLVPSPGQAGDKNTRFSPIPSHDGRLPMTETFSQQQKSVIHPMISALISSNNSSFEKPNHSTRSSPLSTSDAEAQLKALIFGKRGSNSSSERSTPGMSPLTVPMKAKTVAELEADMRPAPKHAPGPSMPPMAAHHHGPPSQAHHAPPPQPPHMLQPTPEQRDGNNDLAAFNKLLSLMRAGVAAAESPPPKLQPPQPMRPDNRSVSPIHVHMNQPPKQLISTAAQNEFLQAVLRNKERQRQLQQQAQMRYQQQMPVPQQPPPQPQQPQLPQPMIPRAQPPTQPQPHPHPPQPSQSHPPDPILNFIKQNPTIITKPASPSPAPTPPPLSNMLAQPSTPRSPSPQVIQQQLLSSQQSTPRIQSPIMFSQQPPRHLSAPSPVHPAQLSAPSPVHGVQLSAPSPVHGVQLSAPSPVYPLQMGQNTLPANTLTTSNSIRPPQVSRVPSPQELIAHTQAIMQNALIKKQLEDQKERFMKKQHDGTKSPNPLAMAGQMKPMPGIGMPGVGMPVIGMPGVGMPGVGMPGVSMAGGGISPRTVQSPTPNKPSVTMAFTPTSVIRKMHSDKVEEKEKQARGETPTHSAHGSPSHRSHSQLEDDSRRLENGPEDRMGVPFSHHPSLGEVSTLGSSTMLVTVAGQSKHNHDMVTTTLQNRHNLATYPTSSTGMHFINPSNPIMASMNPQHSQASLQSSLSTLVQQQQAATAAAMRVAQDMPKVRALVGQGTMQTPLILPPSMPVQVASISGPTQLQGRPIVKGQSIASTMTTPASISMRPPAMQVPKPDIAGQRPIVGGGNLNMDMAKLLEQQQRLQQQQRQMTPAALPRNLAPVTNPYGVPPLSGRLPLQSNMIPPPVNVQPNPLLVQQMMQSGMNPAVRGNVNAMNQLNQLTQINQLNQLSQLAALQAQQRNVDPRLQPNMRAGYLSPRSPVPHSAVNSALGRALSPNIHAQVLNKGLNGPLSPGAFPPSVQFPGAGFPAGGINGNNNPLGKMEDATNQNLAKWFGMEVFKNQLPNMPPLPHQGKKVMTVDEIERSQQAVSH